MQFTVDTRNATAFELNALAEFVQKLAPVAPTEAPGWDVKRSASGAVIASGPGALPVAVAELLTPNAPVADPVLTPALGNAIPDRHINVEVHLPEGYGAVVTEGNGASGAPALPTAAGPVPEVPPAPGSMSAAAAPVSSTPTDVPAVPTSGPAAGASTNAAAVSDKKLDKAGTPWDARIHTSNQAVIGDGTWRKKPGVDPALYAQVMAELTASAAQASTTTPSTVPPVPETATLPEAPALLTGNDVLKRAMEIQMADAAKSAPLFQAIQGAGIVGGPMGLPGTTDPALLQAALDAINAVGAQ